ncbi:ribosome small subunit-dependent GTPase A [Chitinispirillales bacterium ANBcel5]|uniref:ribosome small subunit-dependent GTPase A n=1 Tax=Cellulosispirillum alkaliphilum TaxID=3039283 RepID=UPI002A54A347|nr:ribosome small subunit-dependent GTPase A [Chitinispirillales bacterium ANBcel5]
MTTKSVYTAKVIEEQKNYLVVDTPIGNVKTTVLGKQKKKKRRICTGDIVEMEIINFDSLEGVIRSVAPRKSYLPRPPIANIDQIIFINTFISPSLDLNTLDRYLFTAAVYDIKSVLVFNKTDLLTSQQTDELKKVTDTYTRIGYEVIFTSAKKGSGLNHITTLCTSKLSALTGLSGVGKSSLLSRIFPDQIFRTGEVSGTTGRGTHTTTHTSLTALQSGGYIADTPGFAFIEIPQVDENSVVNCFPEIADKTGECRFNDCKHEKEPGCAVKELVNSGTIAHWRHKHYLKIRKEMEERKKQNWKSV